MEPYGPAITDPDAEAACKSLEERVSPLSFLPSHITLTASEPPPLLAESFASAQILLLLSK